MKSLNLEWIRSQFPSITHEINGQLRIFFDGPGGTQVPYSVIEAMSQYLIESNANAHGAFATSRRTDRLISAAREAMADFLGCSPDEVIFGANMTSLTLAFSRAFARQLQPGDEIVVTRLDHYANVSPWVALEDQGIVIRQVDFNPDDCTLDLTEMEQQINERTRLVAVGYASNAVGTINDIATIVRLAHRVGAMVFVDAVHYAPHGPIDVGVLDCDFLVCSSYKFFGPHVGILYGKREHLARLTPFKVQPAPNSIPERWETGTLNYEGLAGVVATIDYLTKLGNFVDASVPHRRAALVAAMTACQQYEQQLSELLIDGLHQIPNVKVYGITNLAQLAWRTPTVGITISGQKPHHIAQRLGEFNIFTWHGNFYALGVTEKLGLENTGGLLRIGLVHYNNSDEIQQLLKTLREC
ncbi:cysteine desulfurase-like protein [Gloeothece verrucosa]|uniref:Cysteine desulfurase family protein n=1 Tax=Gloeothece verrucosa (strain PCC 7822) TaxID=497965 RepID=E0ULG9_GLOV7|nr:cysteine desulfurase-like protein [Gloeothece verrucosa]ADN17799.1 cysteine desulfurase family protein [Gloeothece verrucosa PCC 7822]